MDLGQQIKSRRQTLKITQRELAREVHVSVQYMSSIEQNQRVPSLPVLLRLAEELQVTLDYLVLGREKIPQDIVATIRNDAGLALEEKRFLIDLIRIWHGYKKK
jgi:transcriptional regulator with XRE-family HTH domain